MKANILLRANVIVRLKALIVFVNFISRDLRDWSKRITVTSCHTMRGIVLIKKANELSF